MTYERGRWAFLAQSDSARRYVALIAGLTFLGGILRFATLGRQSYWSDEAMTVLLTRLGFLDMLHTIPQTESTPPLYYVLAWSWAQALGAGEVGLRSLSALVGTATIPVAGLAGASLAGRRAGVAAAAVVAVSPLLVYYSQEARSYALVILLCGVSFAALTRAMARPESPVPATVWAAASILAIATHYFAIFVVAAEAVWLLCCRRDRVLLRAVATVAVGTLAIGALAFEQRRHGLAEFIGETDPLLERVQVLFKQFLVGARLPADRQVAALVAVVLVLSLALITTRAARDARRGAAVAASVGGAAVAVPILLAVGGLDYVNTRNSTAGLVPLVVAATIGLAVGRPRWLGSLALLATCAVLLSVTVLDVLDPAYYRPDWRGFAREVDRGELPRAVVVAPDHQSWFARAPLQVYLPRARAVDSGLVQELPQFGRVNRRPIDRSSPRWISVREIVLAEVGWSLPVPPAGVPAAFRLVERGHGHGYSYARYRAPQSVSVHTGSLVAPVSAVLYEPSTPG